MLFARCTATRSRASCSRPRCRPRKSPLHPQRRRAAGAAHTRHGCARRALGRARRSRRTGAAPRRDFPSPGAAGRQAAPVRGERIAGRRRQPVARHPRDAARSPRHRCPLRIRARRGAPLHRPGEHEHRSLAFPPSIDLEQAQRIRESLVQSAGEARSWVVFGERPEESVQRAIRRAGRRLGAVGALQRRRARYVTKCGMALRDELAERRDTRCRSISSRSSRAATGARSPSCRASGSAAPSWR